MISVALVPLLLAARGTGWRRGVVLGWWAGVVIEGAGFLWILHAIREFSAVGPILSSLVFGLWLAYAALPWVLLGGALGASRRPIHFYAVLCLWVGIEGLIPRLFTWHIGGALYSRSWVIQCADLLGASGLTAWVFVMNITAAGVVLWALRRRAFPWRSCVGLVVLSAAILVYGQQRLSSLEAFEETRPAAQVLVVQGAVDPRGMDRAAHTRPFKNSFDYYVETTRAALAERTDGASLSLLVWPEGIDSRSFGITPGLDPWLRGHPSGHRPGDRQVLLDLLGPKRDLIFGGVGRHVGQPSSSNVAILLGADGVPQFYEKNRLMPFGERVPLLHLVPEEWLRALDLQIGDRIAGTGSPLFKLADGTRFRQLICYEAVIPDYVRQSAIGADLLVNLTEDIWYGRTAHIPQHASVLILRVVENRTPLLRVTNIGPSGVIDIRGRFHHGRAVFQPEVTVQSVRPGGLDTFYQRFGYATPGVALVLAALLGLLARRDPTGKKVASRSV